eukprot:CAMPEP_0113315426 /NCGR_PEP_ID=MMETSP0010_2-20120614/11099_1 /TAXON_ID=216773 ORGANISM="Corethron hystrix, Strain 308" /NCGR_SAMPLE_ID=MMETSP0010_2 /ASSEMBLY_ACC=CAM_ASM_000155 /LENGTH=140 /DNA_ID=CAMNT_0000171925 /DNA_START=10 /DNA_END=432 /DNA_ORIENTATION=+ /assembly_acc=CAM_ASM_000155
MTCARTAGSKPCGGADDPPPSPPATSTRRSRCPSSAASWPERQRELMTSILVAWEYHHPHCAWGGGLDQHAAHFGSHEDYETSSAFWRVEKSGAPVPFVAGELNPLYLAAATKVERGVAFDALCRLARASRGTAQERGDG